MRRGRLTALAPSRTLLEGFDKGSRAVLATASRGSRDGLAGQGWPIGSARKAMRSRMIQRRSAQCSSHSWDSEAGFGAGVRGGRTRRTGHRRSMSAVHMPHKTCRCVGRAALREPDLPTARLDGVEREL